MSQLAQTYQMNDVTISILISVIGWAMSVASAAFIAGNKWGSISATMKTMSERLARIEGMFELKMKQ